MSIMSFRLSEKVGIRRSVLQGILLCSETIPKFTVEILFSLPKVKNGFVVFGNLAVILRLNKIDNPLKQ